MRIVRRTAYYCVLGGALLLADLRGGSALQRSGTPPPVQVPTPDYSATKSGNTLGINPDLGDPTSRHEMEERRGKMLNVERQKAMVREANQLVQLTAELQVTLARDPQGAAREEALRHVETIEKLARNVRERMKGGH